MRILMAGSGETTARLSVTLTQHGHTVEAQLARFSPDMLEMFGVDGVVVVGPEAQVTTEALQQAVERGRSVFVIASAESPLMAWAQAAQAPAFAYPPNEVEVNKLLDAIRQAEAGTTDRGSAYRRAALGSDTAARLQSGMATRRIVITSPKGGVGKTTVAVNLAVTLALCGVTTYLVDADANAGAMHYHLRVRNLKSTLPILLRRFEGNGGSGALGSVAAGGRLMQSFTTIPDLPTLHFLPGFITIQDLSDPVLQDEARLREFFRTLYEVASASNGVVIVDVGINPAHPVHRAAMSHAEAIAVVVKPEIPDLAHARQWFIQMIQSLEDHEHVSRDQAVAFVAARVKLIFNQVYGNTWKEARNVLGDTLRKQDGLDLQLTPQGIIPLVEPEFASAAVNSDKATDIMVWRYQRKHEPELEPFARAMVDLAAHFVPTAPEAAAKVGLLPQGKKKKLRLFGGKR